MNKILTVILSLLFIAPTWAQDNTWRKSPELDALIVELKQHYASDNLFAIDKRSMTQVDNLSFFIQYIDKPDTPEYKLLKAYLWGQQEAHIIGINRQIRTNVVPWVCPPGFLKGFSHNAENPTQFIENIVWQGLEYTLKNEPNRFKRPDLLAAFGTTSGFIADGLQAKYPCYNRSARIL
ncbi:hypothetical protein [Vibrio parahaemolyticus]|uniref:hypothetical protein n=1 Tax=Vibrio parahaemolyticus TaxID=670 RepID=UPI0009443D0E|nr:hypothetical protein [Vibrio parahaemolyticus]MBE3687225.1 hypothetical protein [Vibrio parahaemolyticus]MBE3803970.1 hypothetical protein [Vibrio parahaemolyticus]MBE3808196.1 hypothetical protein [Vibrio parahaemolyticus]MBE4230046.1 hypothetical protein [Vibrio parahaemolyticus]MBE4394862.1 hypothetical protein [Vibrio parahaemolyticus]